MPPPQRQSEPVERPAEALEQERAAPNVVPEQPRTPVAVREPQHRDLVPRRVTPARDDQLQDGRRAVVAERFGDKRLGRLGKRPSDRQPPFRFKAPDELRKLVEPGACSDRERFLSDDSRDVDQRVPGAFSQTAGTPNRR